MSVLLTEAEHAKNLVKLAQTMRPILKEEVICVVFCCCYSLCILHVVPTISANAFFLLTEFPAISVYLLHGS